MDRLWESLKNISPEWQRDLLLDEVPALARKYGDIAATAAAEWYEQVRAQSVNGSYEALTADSFSDEAIQASIRYKAGSLFGDDPSSVADFLSGALQRWVMYSGRQTIARNADHDPTHPRYARVPTGMRTCAFCGMLASRGFVYHAESSAGGDFHKYHSDCDCQIIPEWDSKTSHITGYDPDAMYSQYIRAREGLGDNPSTNAVLANMRRMFPNDYTDGVQTTA
ncbi:MAG: hypothetical protein LKI88_00790 [Bifidobacterium sp.]|jgi:hypothetical protein|nr:hypothetical protein [Bifidobacterium sp.]MCI1864466.1 hypothetical protein [Bifidobacterium sp.]